MSDDSISAGSVPRDFKRVEINPPTLANKMRALGEAHGKAVMVRDAANETDWRLGRVYYNNGGGGHYYFGSVDSKSSVGAGVFNCADLAELLVEQ